jgi:predicted flap endonuclease-1-like 5' DNA nuclease
VYALLAIAALVVAFALGYWIGRARSAPTPRDEPPAEASLPSAPADIVDSTLGDPAQRVDDLERETTELRQTLAREQAVRVQLDAFADDRRRMFGELAQAQAETARYRALIVSLEDNAPPPLLDGPGAPDDLKLIVGVGPVLERMLHQLGITTYRQIARWSERDIDDYDAKLAEFPGRIRRDGWVTQARSLHQSKYGASVPLRDRG